MDIKFTKVGSRFINPLKIEKFLIIDDEIFLSTTSGREHTLTHDENETAEQAMTRVARKTSERAHDIIYLDASTQNNESMFEEDQASNLLYRQWLNRKNK